MTAPPDLPTLDALHAKATKEHWSHGIGAVIELVNAYPALSARIRELEEHVEAIKTISKRGKRIALLEQTLRGIRQEKQDQLDRVGGGFEFRDKLYKEIAWIDRVLRGEP